MQFPSNVKVCVGCRRRPKDRELPSGGRYEVISILDDDPTMSDSSILAIAEHSASMVITMDKDFGELVFREQRKHNGVLLLRLEDETANAKLKAVKFILEHHGSEMEGRFCVFQNGRLRIRKVWQ